MESNGSYGTSWADQWDNGPDPLAVQPRRLGGGSGGRMEKVKDKVGEGFGKTKAAASTGVKKVKEGTTAGIHWLKDKYYKTTHKS
ncbi:hypothetical protein NMG60_11009538 [Bertholletia excelsa]